jgi:hypothetical protein
MHKKWIEIYFSPKFLPYFYLLLQILKSDIESLYIEKRFLHNKIVQHKTHRWLTTWVTPHVSSVVHVLCNFVVHQSQPFILSSHVKFDIISIFFS